MVIFQKAKNNPIQLIGFLLIGTGIFIRFYYQFIEWTFSGDEINLGKEILKNEYLDLIRPFKNKQSAPPLFILIEKAFSYLGKIHISLRIFTFFTSCVSLLLFERLIRKQVPSYIYLLLLVIITVNPFIYYNSLTLKQYSLDLMMGLLSVSIFLKEKNFFKTYLFFTIWCFISNIGAFFSAGFIMYAFIEEFHLKNAIFNKTNIRLYIKRVLPFLLAPLLYLVYFMWFINQPGADAMQSYMVYYWNSQFLPLDTGVFEWIAIQGFKIFFFFYSTYYLIGGIMLIFLMLGFYSFILKQKNRTHEKLHKIMLIYSVGILIHLILSSLKLYPFSDRLYLYMAPFILLLLGEGIIFSKIYILKKTKFKLKSITLYLFPLILFVSYLTYLPFKGNDILSIIKHPKIDESEHILITEEANRYFMEWFNFTQYEPGNKLKEKIVLFNLKNYKSQDLIISRQVHKFGHLEKTGDPEEEIKDLILKEKIYPIKKFDGFTLYKFK